MEINVCLQFVRDAISLLSRLKSLSSPQAPVSGGASPSVPENAVDSTLTSNPVTNPVLRISRKTTTTDALFGEMIWNGKLIGVTMERTAVAIPVGTYRGYKRDSAHFDMKVVGIDVLNRENIECHPANTPSQLLGCIAVGEKVDGDAIDNSRVAFDRMMAVVPEDFTVEIVSLIA